MASQPDYDVLIAGGGMVGASLAIALASTNARIGLIEAVPQQAASQPSYDDRGLALSLSSQRILAGLGFWEDLISRSHPVRAIHVSDRCHFGCVRLHAATLGIPALGHVVQAHALGEVLLKQLSMKTNIDFICPANVRSVHISPDKTQLEVVGKDGEQILTSHLVIAADGAHSPIRQSLGIEVDQMNYGQTAIVTSVTPERSHKDTAFERFTPDGPLALLPLNKDRCVVVFTVATNQADEYLALDDEVFLFRLQQSFGRRLGVLRQAGPRKSYPLRCILAREQVRERLVVLGNAAHTLHPNGAQGFNLCLRDIAGLAEILIPTLRAGEDPGRRKILNRYLDMRLPDQKAVHRFSHGLATLFYNELPHKVLLRNSAMAMMNLVPPLKRQFMRRATGLYGNQPRLVRGAPL